MRFLGVTPYLYYDDAGAAADWLSSVFGFEEIDRFAEDDGKVANVSMRAGDAEIWIDGHGRPSTPENPREGTWTMVWVDNADDMHQRVTDAGVECVGPMDRPWGVREVQVRDPEGLNWGFIQRLR